MTGMPPPVRAAAQLCLNDAELVADAMQIGTPPSSKLSSDHNLIPPSVAHERRSRSADGRGSSQWRASMPPEDWSSACASHASNGFCGRRRSHMRTCPSEDAMSSWSPRDEAGAQHTTPPLTPLDASLHASSTKLMPGPGVRMSQTSALPSVLRPPRRSCAAPHPQQSASTRFPIFCRETRELARPRVAPRSYSATPCSTADANNGGAAPSFPRQSSATTSPTEGNHRLGSHGHSTSKMHSPVVLPTAMVLPVASMHSAEPKAASWRAQASCAGAYRREGLVADPTNSGIDGPPPARYDGAIRAL